LRLGDDMDSDRKLPAPSIDMDDGRAADWLEDIADLYKGPDRAHVLALVARLRRQDIESRIQDTEAETESVKSITRRVGSAESNLRHVEKQLADALEALHAASDARPRPAVKAVAS
jgi:hypothetical protein